MEEKTKNKLAAIGCVVLPIWVENMTLGTIIFSLTSLVPIFAALFAQKIFPGTKSKGFAMDSIGTLFGTSAMALFFASFTGDSHWFPLVLVWIVVGPFFIGGVSLARFLWRQ
jgi:hypothetical protein